MRLTPLLVVGGALSLVAAAVFSAAWYYTTILHRTALRIVSTNRPPTVEVVRIEGDDIWLRDLTGNPRGHWTMPGSWGLEFDGGHAYVHEIRGIEGDAVRRRFEALDGMPGPGTKARLDNFVFRGDPRSALGLEFEDVHYTSELGETPAWHIPAKPGEVASRWCILVHGKGADRREALRAVPSVHRAGFDSLVIAYRNDPEAPRDPLDRYAYGETEWRDLDSAVEYALANGATDLVLGGFSMGAAIALAFMHHSPRATHVRGLVLEAPVLDFGQVVADRARQRKAPGMVVTLGKRIATRRYGLHWHRLRYGEVLRGITVPVLLLHGEDDTDVPIHSSDTAAREHAHIITYHRVPGAGHVRSWNVDPHGYETALQTFLAALDVSAAQAEPARPGGASTSGS
jgi:uncharacterized protein